MLRPKFPVTTTIIIWFTRPAFVVVPFDVILRESNNDYRSDFGAKFTAICLLHCFNAFSSVAVSFLTVAIDTVKGTSMVNKNLFIKLNVSWEIEYLRWIDRYERVKFDLKNRTKLSIVDNKNVGEERSKIRDTSHEFGFLREKIHCTRTFLSVAFSYYLHGHYVLFTFPLHAPRR